MRRLPYNKLTWIKKNEWFWGDDRISIPWDEPPKGVTNRPLHELLVNDRELVIRILDLLYAIRDIQTTINNLSPVHSDVVIKRFGIRIPKVGVIPSYIHSDLDVRVSAIGEVVRQVKNHSGRCNYTDHADFHEDISHKDLPTHGDLHGDQASHLDTTESIVRALNKPLWVSKHLPSMETTVTSIIHADHQDSHLDISFKGTAPTITRHADSFISYYNKGFSYIPFWRTDHLNQYLSFGTLEDPYYSEGERSKSEFHYDSGPNPLPLLVESSPHYFRSQIHGDHSDTSNPVNVQVFSVSNRGRYNALYGMHPSIDPDEAAGGLTQVFREVLSHSDQEYHHDYHLDEGLGLHGDLSHHDNHYDHLDHCDFTDPHADYLVHQDQDHGDQIVNPLGNHSDYTDHANVAHGDSYPKIFNPCTHTDIPTRHYDLPEYPHGDRSQHMDYTIDIDKTPHGDSWGGTIYHSDFTLSPPAHFDHSDFGTFAIHGTPMRGGFRIGNYIYYVNPHNDLYSQNNHSDQSRIYYQGVTPFFDHLDRAEYSYYHEDWTARPVSEVDPINYEEIDHEEGGGFAYQDQGHNDLHGDETVHGDKPEVKFILTGKEHNDIPGTQSLTSHGDTVVYQDLPSQRHLDHTDHGDNFHCDYPTQEGHTDLHNDYTHQDHDDHANTTTATTYRVNVPHLDHKDHGDL
jgi:hypothetical protein